MVADILVPSASMCSVMPFTTGGVTSGGSAGIVLVIGSAGVCGNSGCGEGSAIKGFGGSEFRIASELETDAARFSAT